MARKHVHTLEDEGPGYVRRSAYNLGVHQVAHADGTGTDGSDDGNVVEHRPQFHVHAADVENEADNEAQGATVTGQTFVARIVPVAQCILLHGQNHFQGMAEKVLGLVEEAMSQTCTDEYAEEAIEDQGVELLLGYTLLAK